MGSGIYYYWQIIKRLGCYRAHGIELQDNRQIKLYNEKGEYIEGGVLHSYFISNWLTTIIVDGQRRYVLLIFPDMLSKNDYRHLRIGLKKYSH